MGSAIWMEKRLGLPIIYRDVMLALGFGAFALVGSLLVAKRPENPVSWIMLAIGLMAGLFPATETYAAYVMTTHGAPDTLAVLGAWFNDIYWAPLAALTFIYLPLLFPNGRLPSRRWLPVAVIPGIATVGFVVLAVFRETLIGQNINYQINNPIGIKGLSIDEGHPFFILLLILTAVGVLGAVAAVFVRFRRSRGVERQQLKMFLYTTAFLPILLVPVPLPLAGDLLFGLIMLALPTAIGVAVLRYRLYDIDIIIRRTLVYGALTATLALVYFGGVLVLQEITRAITGQGRSPIATVISTLGIAALFTPLRRRIQRDIDRRFYRRKYDAQKTLEAFAARARDEVELEQLTAYLLSAVRETLQPKNVSLWIKPIKDTSDHTAYRREIIDPANL
jgi:hypothetical protein